MSVDFAEIFDTAEFRKFILYKYNVVI